MRFFMLSVLFLCCFCAILIYSLIFFKKKVLLVCRILFLIHMFAVLRKIVLKVNYSMKKIVLLLVCLLFLAPIFAQKKLSFSYDASGNQIKRELICINCRMVSDFEEVEELEHSVADLAAAERNDFTEKEAAIISYYPNPTREELYMNWENTPDAVIHSIDVFTTRGQIIRSFTNLSNKEALTIPFTTVPIGTYHVQLHYQDGKKKVIHIIKK